MKKNIIYYVLFNLLILSIHAKKHIILNSNNHAILRGEVSPSSISQLIIDINNLNNENQTKELYLYIYLNISPGIIF